MSQENFILTGQVVIEDGLDSDGDRAWRWYPGGDGEIDDVTLLGMLTVMRSRLKARIASNLPPLDYDPDDEDDLED